MGEVIAHMAMSLDGFIADPDDGCDELFGFYGSGDVAVKLGAGIPELRVSRETADLLTAEVGNEGVPIFFEPAVEAAVAMARELAGDQDVSIAGATITRGCLDAGLLDAIQVSLVPVILGRGIPWLAGTRGPVRLSDPAVIEDRGVTHLRYAVRGS